MKKSIALAGALLALPPAAHATPVTWSFFETGVDCRGAACNLPPQPHELVSLTLPGLTSSGSAEWHPGPRDPASPPPPPLHSGDDFSLSVEGVTRISSSNLTGSAGTMPGNGPNGVQSVLLDYTLAWTETDGILNRILISYASVQDNIDLSFGFAPPHNRQELSTDGFLGGCFYNSGICQLTGFWEDTAAGVIAPAPVPEPASWPIIAMLACGGLFAAWRRNALSRQEHYGTSIV